MGAEVNPDRPMSPAECRAMWGEVYKAERDRFERERDDARFSARMAAVEQERLIGERDRLRAENERLCLALSLISEMGCECTGFYRCGPCVQRIASRAEIALASDEQEATDG